MWFGEKTLLASTGELRKERWWEMYRTVFLAKVMAVNPGRVPVHTKSEGNRGHDEA